MKDLICTEHITVQGALCRLRRNSRVAWSSDFCAAKTLVRVREPEDGRRGIHSRPECFRKLGNCCKPSEMLVDLT
jgi:hypothetical protein